MSINGAALWWEQHLRGMPSTKPRTVEHRIDMGPPSSRQRSRRSRKYWIYQQAVLEAMRRKK